jgi:fucose 4-O-acetylase-like acetyltransferase
MFLLFVSDAFNWSTLASRSADNSMQYQITQRYYKKYSTALAEGIPLFFWCNTLFFQIKLFLFACISYTLLWYWAKEPWSLDWSNAKCFFDFSSSFSRASMWRMVSPYPFKRSVF